MSSANYADVPDADRSDDPDDSADTEHTPKRGEYPPPLPFFTTPASVAW